MYNIEKKNDNIDYANNELNFFKDILRTNINIPNRLAFERLVSFYKKNLKKTKLDILKINKKLEFLNISIEIKETFNQIAKNTIFYKGFSSRHRDSITDTSVYIVEIKTKNNNFSFFTSFDTKFKSKYRYGYFRSESEILYIFDFFEILAELLIICDMRNYIAKNFTKIKFLAIKKINEIGISDSDQELKNLILTNLPNTPINIKKLNSKLDRDLIRYYLDVINNNFYDDDVYVSKKIDLVTLKVTSVKNSINIINTKYKFLCKFIFNEIQEDMRFKNFDDKYNKSMGKYYASSFETKKNIPEKVEEKMKNTNLLNIFKYVELDATFNLETFDILEKNITDLFDLVYFNFDLKYTELRFRRLGKHKAKGIYFPNQDCISIDLLGNDSFIHELIHKLDYSNQLLSEHDEFFNIWILYKNLLSKTVEELDNNDPFKISYFGNSLNNKFYYLNKKEVFARCGEIYLKRVLNLDTPLLNDCLNIVYPDDGYLLALIKDFYSKIIYKK